MGGVGGSVSIYHVSLLPVQLRLEDADDLGDGLASSWDTLPTPLNQPPQAVGKLGVVRSVRSMSLEHRIHPCNIALFVEWNSSSENLRTVSLSFSASSRGTHVYPTHLPSNDPKRVDVAGICILSSNKPDALWVNQFRGSAMEKPIGVHHWCSGCSSCCSKTGNADVSASIDEDVSLDEGEREAKSRGKEGLYSLEVPMDNVGVVHIFDNARDFQQLTLGH